MKYPAIALLMLVASCDALQLTPSEASEVAVLEDKYEEARGKAEAWEEAAASARASALAALDRADEVDYQLALGEFEAANDAYAERVATMVSYREQATSVYKAAADRQVGWVGGLLNALPPGPWKLLLPFLGQGAVIALSSRARKRFLEGVGALAKGNVGEFATGVLKSVGAMHSTPESAKVAEDGIASAKAAALRDKADKETGEPPA